MILDQIRELKATSQVNQLIKTYIVNHPQCIIDNDAKSLAQLTFTSSASIVRFCKSLGFSGYLNFKFKYIEEFYQLENITSGQLSSKSTITEILETLPSRYETVAKNTVKRINIMDLAKIIYQFKKAESIDFYATGINYGVVQAACVRYGNIGYRTQVQLGLNEHYIRKIKENKQSQVLSVLISHTGFNETVVSIAKYLKDRNLPTVYMGRPNTDLHAMCDFFIYWDNDHLDEEFDNLSYPLSLLLILDIIYIQLSKTK